MKTPLLTEKQAFQMLCNLPQPCVYDAIENIEPQPSVDFARFALLKLEEAGFVQWHRWHPWEISLAEKGQSLLALLRQEYGVESTP